MNLYVLRHGLAVEQTIPGFKSDSDRPLLPEGQKKTQRLAAMLSGIKVSFDLILTSPYLRATQTAGIIAEVLRAKKPEISKNLAPGNTLKQLIEELDHRPSPMDNVLLVGHEPQLSRLISILVTGKPGLALELKKGGLCKLEIATLRFSRCANLQWLVAPKVYSQLS
jgi:phosphohistidine phosphatase